MHLFILNIDVLLHISSTSTLQPKPQNAVTIAVSSRTLFNMVAERKIYEEQGVEKYVAFQLEHENEPLKPGASFPFVKVLLETGVPREWHHAAGLCRVMEGRGTRNAVSHTISTIYSLYLSWTHARSSGSVSTATLEGVVHLTTPWCAVKAGFLARSQVLCFLK